MSIRYIGKNGLEYLTAFDAEKYGDGLARTIEYLKPKVIEHVDTSPQTLQPLGAADVVIPTTEALEKHIPDEVVKKLEEVSDEVLRDIAKEQGLRGYQHMKRETLLQRLTHQDQNNEKTLAQ